MSEIYCVWCATSVTCSRLVSTLIIGTAPFPTLTGRLVAWLSYNAWPDYRRPDSWRRAAVLRFADWLCCRPTLEAADTAFRELHLP